MKTKKILRSKVQILFLIIACCMLSGCGTLTAEKVLVNATLKSAIANGTNYKMDADITFDLQAAQRNIKMKNNIQSEVMGDQGYNCHAKSVTTMGSVKQENETYVISEDGRFATYRGTDGKWKKEYLSENEMYKVLNEIGIFRPHDFTGYGDHLENAFMTDDTIDGINCHKITATVPMQNAANETQDMIKSLGIEGGSVQLDNLSSIKMCYWIDKKTYYPVRITMDMKDMMQDIMKESVKGTRAQGQIAINDSFIDMRFHDYGNVGKIELSEEAKGARMN